MSPTSYRAAPPRGVTISGSYRGVKRAHPTTTLVLPAFGLECKPIATAYLPNFTQRPTPGSRYQPTGQSSFTVGLGLVGFVSVEDL
jgi:hypothetical protein